MESVRAIAGKINLTIHRIKFKLKIETRNYKSVRPKSILPYAEINLSSTRNYK